MRNLATPRIAVLALLLWGAASPVCRAQAPADSAPTAATPPPPTRTPVDLRRMMIRRVEPKTGYRYAGLSGPQARVLRRDFRLSLEALAKADSVTALADAAEVAPLPNPNEPILAAQAVAASGGNPFTAGGYTAFREDPMRALGERLGADFGSEAVASGGSSFELSASDPVGAEPDDGAGPASEAFDANDDPFAAEASASDDPFADF